jgi:hypothetical protein
LVSQEIAALLFSQNCNPMFYIHQYSCIAAQQFFTDHAIQTITESVSNKLYAVAGNYDSIPPNILRRLGKAVKMGIATGNQLISEYPVDGIVLGTANGGLEDCIKFLNQIIQFEEGRLTPTNFVQSTTNAIAGQLGIMSSNKGYNITHVHRGLAFENALIDVEMLLNEHPENNYLLGGVDEISDYNYTIEDLAGAYKKEIISNTELLASSTSGTIAGEGAAMFIVNTIKTHASAVVKGIKTLHTTHEESVVQQLTSFLEEHLQKNETVDLILSGKNGDVRQNAFYKNIEEQLPDTPVSYYKHLTGDFPTSSAVALWLTANVLNGTEFNNILNIQSKKSIRHILLYNTYKGKQHSFILVSAL